MATRVVRLRESRREILASRCQRLAACAFHRTKAQCRDQDVNHSLAADTEEWQRVGRFHWPRFYTNPQASVVEIELDDRFGGSRMSARGRVRPIIRRAEVGQFRSFDIGAYIVDNSICSIPEYGCNGKQDD
jgi:hypothetical protein